MFGLRAARLGFRSSASNATVTLFPMVHVGDERFYAEVYADAFGHEAVLIEGVRSSVSRNFTRAYRWMKPERLGLVIQPKTPASSLVAARTVRADLTGEEFEREWRKVPWRLRAAFAVIAPLYGLSQCFFGSREAMAKRCAMEDRLSSDEVLSWNPEFDAVHHCIGDARDERLLQCLAAELDNAPAEGRRIAIVYGPRHMRAVIRELTRRGFHCGEAKWLTIFKT
jgi:hypothetical protein